MTTELFHKEITSESGSGGDIDHATSVMRKIFGFSSLRPHQEEVLEHFLKGEDTLAVIPTGAGKSMCYALPAMMGDGVGVVISPLIALIRDQVIKFRKVGIPAAALDSMQSPEQKRQVVDALRQGSVKLLVISPERFALPRFRSFLKELQVRFVAVDEAHCISQWGSNFRPEYRKLGEYLEDFPSSIPRLALTATATKRVREDILKYLNLRNPAKILKAPMRANLRISVEKESKVDDAEISLVDKVWKSEGQGIVYAGTRKKVEQLSRRLREAGISATAYHAGLSNAMRESSQKAFIEGSVKVVVATNAFGLGIDKNDIRFVHHFGLPGSLENYVQEIGRAGRDEEFADCDMVYTSRDYHIQKFVIDKSHPPVSTLKKCFEIFTDLMGDNSEVSAEDLYKTVSVKSMIENEEIKSGVDTLVKEGFLSRRGFGGYSSFDNDVQLSFGDYEKIADFFKEYPKRKVAAMTRLDSMMVYAGAGDLREQVLKRYFLD
ncbi:ATP-dependent DNA helicase [bacterium]|nr:ATP-dependent DNA helicase [bacterium]